MNRPHYHVWLLAATERAFFQLARGFHTRQSARQYARRRRLCGSEVLVRQCTNPACAPPLD